MNQANKERIEFLRSIYDSYRSDPATQAEIRATIQALKGGKE